ncbi:MAG: hypothetical protein HZB99_04400 [Candidatus Harrisonbacteria bacterium]|nr:hypothetical protein [Candidatus Harrisonbacteria bacterium]
MKTTVKQLTRFTGILGGGLSVGLETTVRRDELSAYLGGDYGKLFAETPALRDHFMLRIPGHPTAQTVSLVHTAEANNPDLLKEIFLLNSSATLRITFSALPDGLTKLFQRLNLKQTPDASVQGLVCQRFTIFPEYPENGPFFIKHQDEDPKSPIGYINLDFFSRTEVWNPLYVKYRLNVVPSEKNLEFGYLKIDAALESSCGIITVSLVSAGNVPPELNNFPTFPR